MVGIKTCSAIDWILYVLFYIFIIILTTVSAFYLKRLYKKKVNLNYEFAKGDMHWTVKQVLIMISFAFSIGTGASALGLGGGVVFNPLLIELGVHPTVASATGMFLVMFSSLSNTVLYTLTGFMNFPWALWQGVFTTVGSIAGLKVINKAIKQTG